MFNAGVIHRLIQMTFTCKFAGANVITSPSTKKEEFGGDVCQDFVIFS